MVRPPMKSEIDQELKKGPWTPEEDQKLRDYIEKHGHGSWQSLPRRAGLNRCGKSCRLRWTNYLRPDIKRGNFSPEEERTIIHLHSSLGNKWAMIATSLPGRTDNEIKNFWNTRLRKKLLHAGIDPNTHQRITDFSLIPNFNNFANLANIRLLQNILGLLNSNPLPSFLGGSDIPNRFDATLDGILINPLQLPSNTENGRLSGDYEPVSNTSRPPEITQYVKNSVTDTELCLPGLIPPTPEIASGNKVQGSDYYHKFTDESWGSTVDDGSFWKDIFCESFPSSSL